MSAKVEMQLTQIMYTAEANEQRDKGNADYRQGYRDGWEKATEYFEASLKLWKRNHADKN